MGNNAELEAALRTLEQFIMELTEKAGLDEDYGIKLWDGIRSSNGLLRELAYYHDFGSFLCEYEIAGYTLADMLVWQVDHFKAYMDRGEDMNRYRSEKLLLSAFETMVNMEKDPAPVIKKLRCESGQDMANS